MKKLWFALFACALLFAAPAHAQKTKAQLSTEVNTNFADNTAGAITAALLRTTVLDIVASYTDWLVCTTQGGLVYWNAAATPTCLLAGTSGFVLQSNGGAANPSWATPTVAWGNVTGTPTTLAGYGITSPLPIAQGGTNCAAASGTCLDNITAFASTGWMKRTGAGAYSFNTASLVLADICATQGDILYYNGAAWVCLATDTDGKFLTTHGAGANPTWTAAAGSGTVTQVAISPGNAAIQTSGTCIIATTGTCTITPQIATNSDTWAATTNKLMDAAGLSQGGQLIALVDAGTISTTFASGVNFSVTLGGNRALDNPTVTTPQLGRTGCYFITQDATGSRTLSYASNWKFAGGTAPTLTTTANATDILCYMVKASNFIWGALTANVK